MLLISGVLIVATATALFTRVWRTAAVDDAPLGWMSAQWLAEHRAAHP